MSDIWPPPPTNQSPQLPEPLPPQASERDGVTALLLTLAGMLLVVVTSWSHMHLIPAASHNHKLGTFFDELGLFGVLLLGIGGALGVRSRHTKYGPNALIMSFFMLLSVFFVVLVLLVKGQL